MRKQGTPRVKVDVTASGRGAPSFLGRNISSVCQSPTMPWAGPAAGTPLQDPNVKPVGTRVSPDSHLGLFSSHRSHRREPCPFLRLRRANGLTRLHFPLRPHTAATCHPLPPVTRCRLAACVVELVPQSLTQKLLGVAVSASTGQGRRDRWT